MGAVVPAKTPDVRICKAQMPICLHLLAMALFRLVQL
jgi:hypothetical protein